MYNLVHPLAVEVRAEEYKSREVPLADKGEMKATKQVERME